MASAGRILIIPKGAWDSGIEYSALDLVTHNSAAWIAKNKNTNIVPEKNSEYWMELITLPVANNLGTEVEGYLLDATQGRILLEKIEEQADIIAEMSEEIEGLKSVLEDTNNDLDEHRVALDELNAKIEELKVTLANIPTITSGTTEPSGGKDGDVYIMYE